MFGLKPYRRLYFPGQLKCLVCFSLISMFLCVQFETMFQPFFIMSVQVCFEAMLSSIFSRSIQVFSLKRRCHLFHVNSNVLFDLVLASSLSCCLNFDFYFKLHVCCRLLYIFLFLHKSSVAF